MTDSEIYLRMKTTALDAALGIHKVGTQDFTTTTEEVIFTAQKIEAFLNPIDQEKVAKAPNAHD